MSNNLDAAEIQNFSAQASTWWDVNGPCKVLHALSATRLKFIGKHCPPMHSWQNCRVLDIGCGAGIFTEELAKFTGNPGQITGIDASSSLIEAAKAHSNIGINYAVSTAEDYAADYPQAFDLICCLEMLEHVPNPYSVISACNKLLRPGGWLVLSTLNRNRASYFFVVLMAELLGFIPKKTHTYEKFIRPDELSDMLRKNHLTPKTIKGVNYWPVINTASLSCKPNINYLICAVK